MQLFFASIYTSSKEIYHSATVIKSFFTVFFSVRNLFRFSSVNGELSLFCMMSNPILSTFVFLFFQVRLSSSHQYKQLRRIQARNEDTFREKQEKFCFFLIAIIKKKTTRITFYTVNGLIIVVFPPQEVISSGQE